MIRIARVLVLVVAVTGVGTAVASPGNRQPAGPANGPTAEEAIGEIIDRASHRVSKRRGCRAVPVESLIDGAPSAALLETLGILRREQTAEDRAAAREVFFPGFGSTYRDYVRVARAASGRAFVIEPGRFTGVHKPRSRACRRAFRREVAGAIEGRPRAFRRRARRKLALTIRVFWKAPRVERELLSTSDYRPDGGPGGGGGGAAVGEIRRRGMFRVTLFSRRPRSVLSGVVPDGVASIDFVFGRKGLRLPGRPPARYRSVFRRSEPVQDNVVGFVVPRRGGDAFPLRMVWRSADGRVVRVVGPPEGFYISGRRGARATTSR